MMVVKKMSFQNGERFENHFFITLTALTDVMWKFFKSSKLKKPLVCGLGAFVVNGGFYYCLT